ncbi:MAG: glycosyltransferase family 4 protein [Candidatus Bathyarchaeia archaeon]|jgi:glycosyltransferase involved in cell wall biosynthesis
MKLVMINDCASVGETLLKYMPPDLEKQHITRSRSFWSKTFGLAYKILRAQGDLYHVHYLLQDCYIASRLGKKPLIGHAHGSDLRQMLRSKKWGWIVKSNLKSCNKILVAQPSILGAAREFNETAEYFPIPFDPEIFFPKQLPDERKEAHVFLASAHDFNIKGTDKFLHALSPLSDQIMIKSVSSGKDLKKAQQLAKELNLNIDFVSKVPHNKMNELYWESDLVLGSLGVGQLDTVAIEAMACGRPVVHSISKNFFPTCPLEELKTINETTQIISNLLINKTERDERVRNQLAYVNSTHSAQLLSKRLLEIYSTFTAT